MGNETKKNYNTPIADTRWDSYLSPFSWRYGTEEMRHIWSEANKRRTWRSLWVSLAEVQSEYGLVKQEQLADLRRWQSEINIDRALEIEADIHHDLMAELRTYAEQARIGGEILHLGATSMDIEDNADVLRIRQSLELIIKWLEELLLLFAEKVRLYAPMPLMAFTHLQPAEPSTLGYRLSSYAQDLLLDWEALGRVRRGLKGKGFKGAVGTGASYGELIGVENLAEFETRLSTQIGLPFFNSRQPGLSAQAGLRRRECSGRIGGFTLPFRLRLTLAAIATDWRIVGTIWQAASWFIRHALQTQPDQCRENRLFSPHAGSNAAPCLG